MAFQYRPLQTTSDMIRLLIVLPCLSSELPLQCTVRHVSLDPLQTRKPRYETISYVWGDPTPSHTILIDGRPLKVPANTDQALRRMAFLDRTRTLWIDAVCINQTDTKERAQQVAMMGKIYSRAKRNLVYLGEEDGMTERAAKMFEALEKEMDSQFDEHGDRDEAGTDGRGGWRPAPSPIHTMLDEEALCAFFSRPWFSRVWVVQEVVLASESRCYCGPLETDLWSIVRIAAWLGFSHFQEVPQQLALCDGFADAANLWNYWREFARSVGGVQFAIMFKFSRGLEASDARDKVFGVLGMCEERFETLRAELLAPDYDKSVRQVIRDAVRYSIFTADDPFDMLRKVSHRDEDDLYDDGFPSWVTRIDRKDYHLLDPNPISDFSSEQEPVLKDWDSEERLATAHLGDPSILALNGTILDEIQDVSPIFDEDTLKNLESRAQLFADILSFIPHNEGQQSHLARTMIADKNNMRSKSSEQDLKGLSATLDHIKAHRRILSTQELPQEASDSDWKATHYWEALQRSSRHRRLAMTKKGLLGLVPKISRASDLAVIFQGSKMPWVLRPHGEDYLFLGQCYLDGAMPWQEEYQSVTESLDVIAEQDFRII